MLREHLSLRIVGYTGNTTSVLNVLVKAGIEGQTIERVCEEAGLAMDSNAMREQLNRALEVSAWRTQEVDLQVRLAACSPLEMPRTGLALALE